MKWQGWVTIAILTFFVFTLFLPRMEISGERYVSMAEDVNEHLQDMESEDRDGKDKDSKDKQDEDAVSSGAVSAAAMELETLDGDKRSDQVKEYDDKIDERIDSKDLSSRSVNNLFFGKWALTVKDTLYFEGTEFVDGKDKKIEDSGVQSAFKIMGILIYVPVLFAIVLIVFCILNKRTNGLLMILLGVMAAAGEALWQFALPGMVWSKIDGYVNSFTNIPHEVLYSDGMGKYTISSMFSHFTSWGRIVILLFSLIFIILGILFMTALKERYAGGFQSEMPEFPFVGPAGGFANGAGPAGNFINGTMPTNDRTVSMDEMGDPLGVFANVQMPPQKDFGVSGTIRCIAGQFRGSVFELRQGEEFVIGRDPKHCHLILTYQKISRKHCGIKFDGYSGNYLVMDYSSNGTRLSSGGKVASTSYQQVLPGTTLYLATEKEAFLLE